MTSDGDIQQPGFDLTFTTVKVRWLTTTNYNENKCRYIYVIIRVDLFEKRKSVRTKNQTILYLLDPCSTIMS